MKKDLYKAFTFLKNEAEVEQFLIDLLTPAEREEFSHRFEIAQLLWSTELSYIEIAKRMQTSTTTVTRVARFLYKEQNKGYKTVLERMMGAGK